VAAPGEDREDEEAEVMIEGGYDDDGEKEEEEEGESSRELGEGDLEREGEQDREREGDKEGDAAPVAAAPVKATAAALAELPGMPHWALAAAWVRCL